MDTHLQQATSLHRQGRIAEAEAVYQEILRIHPDHAGVLHLLGIAALQTGRTQHGIELIGRSIEVDPSQPDAHVNIGRALLLSNRPDQALASFDRALRLKPDSADTLNDRGNTLLDLNRPREALASYERALQLQPRSADLVNNCGSALRALGRPQEALASFERSLQLKPDFSAALSNLAYTLLELKRPQAAVACYERLLQLKPDDVEALNNCGNALLQLKRPEDALACYDRLLQIRPDFAAALTNRGSALLMLKRPEPALASHERALQVQPDMAAALSNRGDALRELKRTAEAIADYERALQLQPDLPEALAGLGTALATLRRHQEAASCFRRLLAIEPDRDYALGNMVHEQLHCCDWTEYERSVDRIIAAVRSGGRAIPPGSLLAVADCPATQLQCARTFVADAYPTAPLALCADRRGEHDRIRVAYLSTDFHNHATAYLMAGLLERHDRQRFEISAVSFGPDAKDEMRERLQRTFDRFVDVRAMSDLSVARLLREFEIDIAVDLKGFTSGCRAGILAHRPAPLQVNYLGYPGSMGADYIDYIIADSQVIPPPLQGYYSEAVAYLPDCYQPNDNTRPIAQRTPSRAEAGLPEHGFVFCCFNAGYKITPDVFAIWMRLLNRVPGSALWLMEGSAIAADNLRHAAAERGVAPSRLVFAPRMQLDQHLARYRIADLFLDTLPCNAHTTASDALWAGLPVLTRRGKTFAGRVAASLLHAVGIPELIVETAADYEAQALQLATDPTALAAVHEKLARNRDTSPLFDTERYCRRIEAAYSTMWQRHLRGEPPSSFTVAT